MPENTCARPPKPARSEGRCHAADALGIAMWIGRLADDRFRRCASAWTPITPRTAPATRQEPEMHPLVGKREEGAEST